MGGFFRNSVIILFGSGRERFGGEQRDGGGRTVLQVLGPLLRGHVGLVLLAVEAQQAVLVAEVLHLAAPLHALPQHALGPAAVTASGLRGGGRGVSDAGLRAQRQAFPAFVRNPARRNHTMSGKEKLVT